MSLNYDYGEFISKHNSKKTDGNKSKCTHTRIGNSNTTPPIYGGSYIIPTEDLETFYGLYYNYVFEQKKPEYLTEAQLPCGGPIAIDLDFRYNPTIKTRIHTKSHVEDIILTYLEKIKEIWTIENNKPFPVFVFEKQTPNTESDKLTKDGIHIIIGIQSEPTLGIMLRNKVLEILPDVCDLPLINSWESVLDEGISKGFINWQLYGSRKPGCDAYELTGYFQVTADSPSDLVLEERPLTSFSIKERFSMLSVQYPNHPKYELTPSAQAQYDILKNTEGQRTRPALSSRVKRIEPTQDMGPGEYIPIDEIANHDILSAAVAQMIESFTLSEYPLREIHEFTQALPEKYYAPGSHCLNYQVAFALKHTSPRLFLSWVALRAKASDFDFSTIPDLFEKWKSFRSTNESGVSVTKRSIMYWLKNDAPQEYERIKQHTIDFHLETMILASTEYDAAKILYEMYKDQYICVSYDKRGAWYEFKHHRWVQDRGISLRAKISTELYNLFGKKAVECETEMIEFTNSDERRDFLKKKLIAINTIKISLKTTKHKDHIMREASEIFFDSNFMQLANSNRELLCFTNGVVDFKAKEFRQGLPEDYITISTGIPYVPWTRCEADHKDIIEQINDFMSKLFPIDDLREYMWDHLASCLIGINYDQTFHIYHGSGSNGKSLLVELMACALGEYKGTVPITLVTDSRGKIGGTSDEILKLKYVRYAVMQELTKGARLNEGVMKELTGSDPIQVRGLYKESEVFVPQFNLVGNTNNLFEIESNDDGTWRRNRRIPFPSKFVDEGEYYEDRSDHVFKKDKQLAKKLPTFAPVFASMLVQRAYTTGGIVKNCKTVIDASKQYRASQDHISAFISERIVRTENQTHIIKKRSVAEEFKLWFQQEFGSRKMPKCEELYEVLNKRFPVNSKKAWVGVQFVEEDDGADMLTNG